MGNSEQGHGPSKVETKAARVSASAPPTLDHLRGKPEDFVALADAELVFDGTVLSVHRAILANASAWFRSLFSALQEEVAIGSDITFSREQFEDVSLADFCSFLRCLYTPTAKVVREELIKVQREAGKCAAVFKSHCKLDGMSHCCASEAAGQACLELRVLSFIDNE